MTQSSVSASELAHWLDQGSAVLVDVRSPEEFRAEHVALALSVPLDRLAAALPALALADPLGFAAYAAVSVAVRAGQSQGWTRGR